MIQYIKEPKFGIGQRFIAPHGGMVQVVGISLELDTDVTLAMGHKDFVYELEVISDDAAIENQYFEMLKGGKYKRLECSLDINPDGFALDYLPIDYQVWSINDREVVVSSHEWNADGSTKAYKVEIDSKPFIPDHCDDNGGFISVDAALHVVSQYIKHKRI